MTDIKRELRERAIAFATNLDRDEQLRDRVSSKQRQSPSNNDADRIDSSPAKTAV